MQEKVKINYSFADFETFFADFESRLFNLLYFFYADDNIH